jgi:hypothetical protein
MTEDAGFPHPQLDEKLNRKENTERHNHHPYKRSHGWNTDFHGFMDKMGILI